MADIRTARDILPKGYVVDWKGENNHPRHIPVHQHKLAKTIAALEAAIYAVRRVVETSGRTEHLEQLRAEYVEEYEMLYDEINNNYKK